MLNYLKMIMILLCIYILLSYFGSNTMHAKLFENDHDFTLHLHIAIILVLTQCMLNYLKMIMILLCIYILLSFWFLHNAC